MIEGRQVSLCGKAEFNKNSTGLVGLQYLPVAVTFFRTITMQLFAGGLPPVEHALSAPHLLDVKRKSARHVSEIFSRNENKNLGVSSASRLMCECCANFDTTTGSRDESGRRHRTRHIADERC